MICAGIKRQKMPVVAACDKTRRNDVTSGRLRCSYADHGESSIAHDGAAAHRRERLFRHVSETRVDDSERCGAGA
jgi:hypothetical protein